MTIFTKLAAAIFAAFDSAGNSRRVDNAEVATWGTEVERLLSSGGFKTIDAQGPFSGRAAYNSQPKGFIYLSVDGDGVSTSNAVGFIKKSNTSGDWSVPVPWQGIQGPDGRDFTPSATGLLSARSAYDGEAPGFSYLATDTGNLYFRQGVSGWSAGTPFGKGETGDAGWAPVLAVATDGSRRVLQVVDWTGGEGTKPTTLGYIGATGIVPLIANGVDIRGAVGATGGTGAPGTPGAAGADGAKWYSGSGAPSGGIGANGDYYLQTVAGGGGAVGDVWLKASGTWSVTGNIRGASGAGTGDMVKSTYDPTGKNGDAFAMDNMVEGAATKIMTATERTKLGGIAAGATANSSDAALLARANHTGTQAIATVTGLQTALDGKYATADKASAANIRAGTADKVVTSDGVLSAMDWVAITAGASPAIDHAASCNRTITHSANATMGAPSNAKPGWPLNIDITPSTFTTSWNAAYKFGSAGAPSISARRIVHFFCRDASTYVYLGMSEPA